MIIDERKRLDGTGGYLDFPSSISLHNTIHKIDHYLNI